MKRFKASQLWSVETTSAWKPTALRRIAPYVQTPTQLSHLPYCRQFFKKHLPHWHINKLKSVHLLSGHAPLNLPFYQQRLAAYWQGYATMDKLWAIPAWGALKSPQHMLHHPALEWGFQLTESQITQGIHHFLNQSGVACLAFVQALLQRHQDVLAPLAREKAVFLATVQVITTEQSEQRPLALTICWQGKKQDYALWISFCLKSPSVLTALPEYWQQSRQRIAQNAALSSYYFTVYTNTNKRKGLLLSAAQSETWQWVTWATLLQRWECYLTLSRSGGNQEFSRFRRTLWQGITGY